VEIVEKLRMAVDNVAKSFDPACRTRMAMNNEAVSIDVILNRGEDAVRDRTIRVGWQCGR
jgi:hypothetical protein